MSYNLNIPERAVKEMSVSRTKILNCEDKIFPLMIIDTDSYAPDLTIHTAVGALDPNNLVYNVQVGKHCAIAAGTEFIIDLNHDYKAINQGRISGIKYTAPTHIKRKGHIFLQNDCWIANDVKIMGALLFIMGVLLRQGLLLLRMYLLML